MCFDISLKWRSVASLIFLRYFFISGDFADVITEVGEIISTYEIFGYDSDGVDVTSTILDMATKSIVDDKEIKVRCRAGVTKFNYKITFRCVTSLDNKWEVDGKMKVKDI